MGYSFAAAIIKGHLSSLEGAVSGVNNVSFDSVWKGSAHDTLTTDVKNAISNINTQKEQITKFAETLEKLQEYKDNQSKISALESKLNSLSDTEENAALRSQYSSDISSLKSKNDTLKSTITSILSSFSSVSTQFTTVQFDPSEFLQFKDYLVDVDELFALFKGAKLKKIADGDTLFNHVSKSEVESRMNDIKSIYSGRDAAVNCALGIIDIASEVGLKLDYDWGGGHANVTTLDHISSGVDCSGFASWAINQGAAEQFRTRGTISLVNVGKKIPYEDAQPGDILVYNNGSNGHVVMIIENDKANQRFLVAEAAGKDVGVIMQNRSYSSISGTYAARDLSSIYGE